MPRILTPRVILAAAVLAEIAAYVWGGVLRYENQGMTPNLFDMTQTGNILSLVFLAMYVWPCARMFLRKDSSRTGATVLLVFGASAIIALAVRDVFPLHDNDAFYTIFGVLQLAALGLVTALVSHDETHVALRSVQHAAIILVFVFGGTIAYGLATPTDVPSSHRADAGVILGAAVWSHNRPSPLLRMRIVKANDLLRATIVSTIVCTGSNALGERPEAEVERAELVKLGVDPSSIITESRTNSTIGQIMFLRDSLQRRGFHSFVIVSDHFHLQRALEMCRFNGLSVRGAASESLLPWALLTWYRVRDAAALLLYWEFGT